MTALRADEPVLIPHRLRLVPARHARWLVFTAALLVFPLCPLRARADSVVLVKEFPNFPPGTDRTQVTNLTDVNGTLFFAADDRTGTHGNELWKHDGTAAGTVLVRISSPARSAPIQAN